MPLRSPMNPAASPPAQGHRAAREAGRRNPRLLQLTTISRTLVAFLRPFGDHFRAKGWFVGAGASDPGSAEVELRPHFDALHRVPWARTIAAWSNYSEAIEAVRKLVREGDYDLVHVHTPIAAFLARYALRGLRAGTKVIYTAHGLHFGFSQRPVWLSPFFFAEKLAAHWTDALVVINRRDFETARRFKLAGRGRLYHSPGIGVDVQALARGSSDLRRETRRKLGIADSEFMLLMVAEFNPGKRHLDLFHALKSLNHLPLRTVLAGDGRCFESYRRQAAAMGLAGRTQFLGFRGDVPALIQAADATTLPSEREGMPRSVMESMAAGTPVIGTNIRGMEELLGDGAGLLVPVGDSRALAESIAALASDPKLRASCAAAARERIEAFDIQQVLACYEAVYHDMLTLLPTERKVSLSISQSARRERAPVLP